MSSVSATQPIYTPLSPIGRPEKDTTSQRPDIKVVKFAKGNQMDSRGQEKEITHAANSEKKTTYTADGIKSADNVSGDNKKINELYLEFDHDEGKLVWKEDDPVFGQTIQYPAKQVTQRYGRMDGAIQDSSPEPSKDKAQLRSLLETTQGA